MTENQLKYYLSTPRFNTYLSKTNNNFEKAYTLYQVNIQLSEAFYPLLSVLEVSLRNSIHETLTFLKWLDNDLPKLLTEIDRFNDVLNNAKSI